MIIFHKDTVSTLPSSTIAATSIPATLPKITTTTAATSLPTIQPTADATVIAFTTTAEPTKEELLSASCFPPSWPEFAEKTLVKLNVLDRTKCLGICQRIPECLGFAAENRFCILKLSDKLENLKSATGIYKFLRYN